MLNVRFLSLVATHKTPQPQFFSIPAIENTPNIRWLGLLLALLLHFAWLMMLANAKSNEQELSLPKAIMVSLINENAEKNNPAKAIEQPKEKPAPTKTTKAETKPITKAKAKTKTQSKPIKPKPVLAAQSELATNMTVPSTEKLNELPKDLPKSTPAPSPAASSNSQHQSHTTTGKGASTPNAPLTLPNLNANYLHNPAPHYPNESRQEGEEGNVLLRVFVGVSGNVEQVTLKKSSGFSRLDEAALTTVKRWRFVPAHRGDQAVSAWVVVPVSFSLDE